MTNRVLALLLMLALAIPAVAAPATAFGQSAGDDQYVDPFQDDDNSGGGNQGNSGSQNGGDDTTAPDQSVAQAPADTGDTAGVNAEEGTDAGTTLPLTGLPLGGLALLGVILLGGGFALRRACPHPR